MRTDRRALGQARRPAEPSAPRTIKFGLPVVAANGCVRACGVFTHRVVVVFATVAEQFRVAQTFPEFPP